jgi:septum formation protein
MLKGMGKNQPLKLPPLILASTSKYRGELLSQLGWEFTAMAPGVDEDELKKKNLTPQDLAKQLSFLKAEAVFKKRLDAAVIGSDQVCHCDGKILGKPHTFEKAVEQLLFMQGKSHELLTAVTIITPTFAETFLNATKLTMRKLSRESIESYVKADSPLDCAGSYKLESRGIKLFESIQTEDSTAIIGLPLIELANTLVKLGWPI